MRNLKLSFQHREVTTMKQITNKEYEEWQKYKAEKAKGHIPVSYTHLRAHET